MIVNTLHQSPFPSTRSHQGSAPDSTTTHIVPRNTTCTGVEQTASLFCRGETLPQPSSISSLPPQPSSMPPTTNSPAQSYHLLAHQPSNPECLDGPSSHGNPLVYHQRSTEQNVSQHHTLVPVAVENCRSGYRVNPRVLPTT